MTFTGTQAAINAALDGMSFLPPLDYRRPGERDDHDRRPRLDRRRRAAVRHATPSTSRWWSSTTRRRSTSTRTTAPARSAPTTCGRSPRAAASVRIADIDATLADIDSANLASLTVTITNLLDGVDEVLTANTAGTSIIATYVPGSGVLTLNGADTVANYQTVLRTVRYENLSDAPNPAQRVITFVASDGGSASNVGTARVTIAAVNDAPTADIAAAALRRHGERHARAPRHGHVGRRHRRAADVDRHRAASTRSRAS